MEPEIRKSKVAVSPARAAAFDILLRVEQEASFASELLHSAAYERFSKADHGLTTELVMGVLRWRSRLDADLAGSSAQPMRKLDLEVHCAAIGALSVALAQSHSSARRDQRECGTGKARPQTVGGSVRERASAPAVAARRRAGEGISQQ